MVFEFWSLISLACLWELEINIICVGPSPVNRKYYKSQSVFRKYLQHIHIVSEQLNFLWHILCIGHSSNIMHEYEK